MRYTLLFESWELSFVDTEDADSPTFFGTYELLPGIREEPELAQVLAYLDFSVRTWPLIEEDRIDEIPAEEEEQFSELIESSAWCLREPGGKRMPILIPVFCTDGQVNWRLNPDPR